MAKKKKRKSAETCTLKIPLEVGRALRKAQKNTKNFDSFPYSLVVADDDRELDVWIAHLGDLNFTCKQILPELQHRIVKTRIRAWAKERLRRTRLSWKIRACNDILEMIEKDVNPTELVRNVMDTMYKDSKVPEKPPGKVLPLKPKK